MKAYSAFTAAPLFALVFKWGESFHIFKNSFFLSRESRLCFVSLLWSCCKDKCKVIVCAVFKLRTALNVLLLKRDTLRLERKLPNLSFGRKHMHIVLRSITCLLRQRSSRVFLLNPVSRQDPHTMFSVSSKSRAPSSTYKMQVMIKVGRFSNPKCFRAHSFSCCYLTLVKRRPLVASFQKTAGH